jgi:hypothetical protein
MGLLRATIQHRRWVRVLSRAKNYFGDERLACEQRSTETLAAITGQGRAASLRWCHAPLGGAGAG